MNNELIKETIKALPFYIALSSKRPSEVSVFGGCLRSLDTGMPIKDIDILVQDSAADRFTMQMIELGYSVKILGQDEDDMGINYIAINGHLSKVLRFEKDGEFPVEFLVIRCDVDRYIRDLPISSSCIRSLNLLIGDSSRWVSRSDEYLDFLLYKQIVISDSRLRPDYIERMRLYYPDHQVIVEDDREHSDMRGTPLVFPIIPSTPTAGFSSRISDLITSASGTFSAF